MKNFKFKKICADLLSSLNERQKSILSRRFALNQEGKETLESIGKDFDICRERVRQIENTALNKIRKDSDKYKEMFFSFIDYLKNGGGLKKERTLLKELGNEDQKELFFLLTLRKEFKRKKEDNNFHALWTINNDYYSKLKENIKKIIKNLKEKEELMTFEELKGTILEKDDNILKSYLETSKMIQKNRKGLYGLSNWPEINPKGVKDKAYLTFKEIGEPLHFSKVSELIEGSNTQTVHNELIKNDEFVLIGRGIYALAEWGYRPGKVKDVIERTLKEAGEPLAKEKILERVSEKREVKKNTILLNLGDREKFKQDSDGKYQIKTI